MISEETQNKTKIGEEEENIENNPFLKNDTILDIDSINSEEILQEKSKSKLINRNMVYEKIKELSPINIYQLQKELKNISYSSLFSIVRDLEFVRLIKTKIIPNADGGEQKIIELINPTQKNKINCNWQEKKQNLEANKTLTSKSSITKPILEEKDE